MHKLSKSIKRLFGHSKANSFVMEIDDTVNLTNRKIEFQHFYNMNDVGQSGCFTEEGSSIFRTRNPLSKFI